MTEIPGGHTAQRWWRLFVVSWALVGCALVVAIIGWSVGKIAGALTPFILAFVITYLLRGPVTYLEGRRVPRGFGVLICYLIGLGILTLIGVLIVPLVERQLVEFLKDFPGYVDRAGQIWADLSSRFGALQLPAWFDKAALSIRDSIAKDSTRLSASTASGVLTAGTQAASFVFNVLFAFVIGFWALKDYPKIREELLVLLSGRNSAHEAEHIMSTVSTALGGYLRGQLIVSVVTGSLAGIGLAIVGVPYALVLGIIVGVLNIVPYLGPLIGGFAAAVSAAFVDPWLALWAILIVIAAQQFTDVFITPRVMSDQVDLHPLLVIFSLLVGGTLFGVVGMLLAIPVAAIAKGIFVYYYEKLTDRDLATEDGVLFHRAGSVDDSDVDADDGSSKEQTPDANGPDAARDSE